MKWVDPLVRILSKCIVYLVDTSEDKEEMLWHLLSLLSSFHRIQSIWIPAPLCMSRINHEVWVSVHNTDEFLYILTDTMEFIWLKSQSTKVNRLKAETINLTNSYIHINWYNDTMQLIWLKRRSKSSKSVIHRSVMLTGELSLKSLGLMIFVQIQVLWLFSCLSVRRYTKQLKFCLNFFTH